MHNNGRLLTKILGDASRILSPRQYTVFFSIDRAKFAGFSLSLPLPLPLMLIIRLVHASFVRESAVNYSTATQQQAGLKWRSV